MPFFNKKRSDSPDSGTMDKLASSLSSFLSMHNPSGLDSDQDGTPKTRPNSFCSIASSNSSGQPRLDFVCEEDEEANEADSLLHQPSSSPIDESRPNRRASDTSVTRDGSSGIPRFGTQRRARPFSIGPDNDESGMPFLMPTRRRQASLSLAVDELDIKRQKRCSVPSFAGTYYGSHYAASRRDSAGSGAAAAAAELCGWSFAYAPPRSRTGSASNECPTSPVLPFSPILPSADK
ncbi:hypothetical protein OC861_004346 [Tilletia horrida]|nr:hypothetical protein OC845_004124 [Tilletia horrida]KAK0564348.1 hypothetical protein OC861_004346 [Tilletia horrida]